MPRDSLGEFEQLVLLACLQLGDHAYAVPIVHEIENRTGRATSHAAVYVALRRLEAKGLVTSLLEKAPDQESGRSRRVFNVSRHAVTQLVHARESLLAMWKGLEVSRR